jgi:hypothetical protein
MGILSERRPGRISRDFDCFDVDPAHVIDAESKNASTFSPQWRLNVEALS